MLFCIKQCNKIMWWWWILLVLVATGTADESWESDDGKYDDQSRDERRNSLSRIADEGAENPENDDASFEKTFKHSVTASNEIYGLTIEKSNENPVDISFPTDKIFVTTDKISLTEKGFPTDKDFSFDSDSIGDQGFPTDKKSTSKIPIDTTFPTYNSSPTVPSLSTDINLTKKDLELKDKEFRANEGFPTDEGFSTNKSSIKIKGFKHDKNFRFNKNITPNETLNYEENFTTNKSPITTEGTKSTKSKVKPKVQQYTFWRNSKNPNVTRRMFGGTRAGPDAAQGRAVALLDSAGAVHCSGAALTRLWVLTVAHCLSKSLTLVLAASDVRHVPVRNLYYHRYHKAVQRYAEQGGLAVTTLEHDVGLAEAVREMHIPQLPALKKILDDMQKHFVHELHGQDVSVYGFGRKEGVAQGAELFSIRTKMIPCMSNDWVPCVCSAGSKGVCVGDSGGPVFYKDAQVAITSLGPMTCSATDSHSSVFTTLQPYVPLLRSTVPSMPEYPYGPCPPKPSEPNPDDYWIKLKIYRSGRAAPRVVVTNLLFIVVPVAIFAL